MPCVLSRPGTGKYLVLLFLRFCNGALWERNIWSCVCESLGKQSVCLRKSMRCICAGECVCPFVHSFVDSFIHNVGAKSVWDSPLHLKAQDKGSQLGLKIV